VHKDHDSMRHRSMRRASHMVQVLALPCEHPLSFEVQPGSRAPSMHRCLPELWHAPVPAAVAAGLHARVRQRTLHYYVGHHTECRLLDSRSTAPLLSGFASSQVPLVTFTRCLRPACCYSVQVALTESAQHAKDQAGQLQAVMAANAALESRTRLLEMFMGLHEPGEEAEQTGDCQWPCCVSSGMTVTRSLSLSLSGGPSCRISAPLPACIQVHAAASAMCPTAMCPNGPACDQMQGCWLSARSHVLRAGTEAWWLDGVTRQMVEQQLRLGRALTFTLRAGHPIMLTRAQVRAISQRMEQAARSWHMYI